MELTVAVVHRGSKCIPEAARRRRACRGPFAAEAAYFLTWYSTTIVQEQRTLQYRSWKVVKSAQLNPKQRSLFFRRTRPKTEATKIFPFVKTLLLVRIQPSPLPNSRATVEIIVPRCWKYSLRSSRAASDASIRCISNGPTGKCNVFAHGILKSFSSCGHLRCASLRMAWPLVHFSCLRLPLSGKTLTSRYFGRTQHDEDSSLTEFITTEIREWSFPLELDMQVMHNKKKSCCIRMLKHAPIEGFRSMVSKPISHTPWTSHFVCLLALDCILGHFPPPIGGKTNDAIAMTSIRA